MASKGSKHADLCWTRAVLCCARTALLARTCAGQLPPCTPSTKGTRLRCPTCQPCVYVLAGMARWQPTTDQGKQGADGRAVGSGSKMPLHPNQRWHTHRGQSGHSSGPHPCHRQGEQQGPGNTTCKGGRKHGEAPRRLLPPRQQQQRQLNMWHQATRRSGPTTTSGDDVACLVVLGALWQARAHQRQPTQQSRQRPPAYTRALPLWPHSTSTGVQCARQLRRVRDTVI